MRVRHVLFWRTLGVILGLAGSLVAGTRAPAAVDKAAPAIELKAWGVTDGSQGGPGDIAAMKVQRAFQERWPQISLVPATGLQIPGRAMDTTPLMQIAGDISPAVLYVNFRQSDTYIRSRFLYPLDRYLEGAAGTVISNGHLLATAQYVAALQRGTNYAAEFETRLAPQVWDVIRRECPYAAACPYVRQWGCTPAARHEHVWALPQSQAVIALFHRRDLFAEAGLPDRVPDTMDELLAWARLLHNPRKNVYGINISLGEPGWSTLGFLYSSGGRVVERDGEGNWRCVFNSPEAVDAYHYVARLFLEPFTNAYGRFTGVVNMGEYVSDVRFGMWFNYIDNKAFERLDPNVVGFGPTPADAAGRRGSEFNALMTGIYAGCENNVALRDAAWQWIFFRGGRDAEIIHAKSYVENGLGRFVQPHLLALAGYPEFIPEVPKGWSEASVQAVKAGIPEPYGRNCQMVYRYLNQAIDQIRTDREVARAIAAGDAAGARRRIGAILDSRVELANDKMLNVVPEPVRAFRARVAAAVALLIVVVFVFVFRTVFRAFSANLMRSDADRARGDWQFGRNKLAYLILLPSMASIALWSYWPLLRGTTMAFQDYNVRGFSTWVGLDNFGAVLFSAEFWHSMGVSLQYTVMFMTVGFVAPIILALLLSEVPRGKILFRTIYYLPAMLSGVVVIFLFKSFYGEYGLINQMLNIGVRAVNALLHTDIGPFASRWLELPRTALICCMLPTIWAGMGPGCLIYLAALKGIPDDLYDAADIDGAGAFHKAWHITLPSMRALIAINFIGAAIGCMQSGSGYILAMTGGGPYTPYGATEVIGLHIFWEAFMFLRFGIATAMAWVLGAMLIGFTVLQLKRLSKMEFKAAGGQ